MEKYYFNAQKKQVEERKYNIFIGISLGVLKPLTKELAKKYISWALKNTKNKVVILIADEIAKFNYRIFGKYSEGKSLRSALKEGKKYEDFFQKIKEEFSKQEQKKILILKWRDIWDEQKEKIRAKLDEKFQSNKEFREIIISFVKKYTEKRRKKLDKEKFDYLSQYILAELPTLLDGIEYDKKNITFFCIPHLHIVV